MIGDTKGLRKRQIGSVGTCLIPSLDSCTDRVEENRKVESFGMIPSMVPFASEGVEVFLIQFFDRFEFARALRHESTLSKVGKSIVEVMLVSIGFDVGKETFLWNTDKRGSNSGCVNIDPKEKTGLENSLSGLIVCHEGHTGFPILLSNIV